MPEQTEAGNEDDEDVQTLEDNEETGAPVDGAPETVEETAETTADTEEASASEDTEE